MQRQQLAVCRRRQCRALSHGICNFYWSFMRCLYQVLDSLELSLARGSSFSPLSRCLPSACWPTRRIESSNLRDSSVSYLTFGNMSGSSISLSLSWELWKSGLLSINGCLKFILFYFSILKFDATKLSIFYSVN